MSRLLFALLLLQAAAPQTALSQLPGNTTPGQPVAPAGDPAAAKFVSDGGLLFVSVKPDKVDDYEDAIRALQDALSKTTDQARRTLAQGWRVYKVAEPDAKANVLFLHVIHPTVPDADYRPSLLLDELLAGAPPELLSKYRDAIAASPTKLGVTEVAHMAVPPKPKPANASPAKPELFKKPEPPKKPGL